MIYFRCKKKSTLFADLAGWRNCLVISTTEPCAGAMKSVCVEFRRRQQKLELEFPLFFRKKN